MGVIEKLLLEERHKLISQYGSVKTVQAKKTIRKKIAAIDQELRKIIVAASPVFNE